MDGNIKEVINPFLIIAFDFANLIQLTLQELETPECSLTEGQNHMMRISTISTGKNWNNQTQLD